jgi:hypothetical protein
LIRVLLRSDPSPFDYLIRSAQGLNLNLLKFQGARPKFSNCKISGPMAGSAAASKQIPKPGVILAWLGCVGLA